MIAGVERDGATPQMVGEMLLAAPFVPLRQSARIWNRASCSSFLFPHRVLPTGPTFRRDGLAPCAAPRSCACAVGEHPSSACASLRHLLPQWEKAALAYASPPIANTGDLRWRQCNIPPSPLVGQGVEAKPRRMRGAPARAFPVITGSLCRRPFGSRSRGSVKVVVAPRPNWNPKDLSQMDPARRVCRWRAPAASGGLGRATSTTCAAFLADRLAIGETERISIHRKCSKRRQRGTSPRIPNRGRRP